MKAHKNLNLNPRHIFIAGLLVIPSFLFQSSLILKWIQAALFITLSALSGRRIKILPNLIMISGIVIANLLTPVGEVLFTVLGFPVTSGAFMNGLERASLLVGMIYISRYIVRTDLMLPGKVGNLLSLVFFYLEKIMEGKQLSKKNLLLQIDEKIIHVYRSSDQFTDDVNSMEGKISDSSILGLIYLLSLIIVNWILFAVPFF